MSKLVPRVKLALNDLCRHPGMRHSSNGNWTKKLKNAMVSLGHERGHKVCANRVNDAADFGEYLFDVTWIDYGPTGDVFRRTVLALESEWDRDKKAIKDDFEKLLVARADLRVMVFDIAKREDFQIVVDDLLSYVRKCRQSEIGDHYLFSGRIKESLAFKHQAYSHRQA